MQPIECRQCGTAVLVEKYSLSHTSVQWLSDAATACPRFAEATAADGGSLCGTTAMSCSALATTIDEAVLDGRIDVITRVEPVIGKLT